MLDERLEQYIEIGDIEGMRFLCRNFSLGIKTETSLFELMQHHVGYISINLNAAIFLLSILEKEYSTQYLEILESSRSASINNFKFKFSNILIDYLISNNVINLDMMRFDETANKFYIKQHGFKLKHVCYRNLLMSFGIIAKRSEGGYFYCYDTSFIAKKTKEKRNKITLAQLENSLQQQSEEGELGEQFVLKYEFSRLSKHPQKNQIRQISSIDVSAGYDIVSFLDVSSKDLDKYIEVKTYRGTPHFYWSKNERNIAKIKKNHYFIYLVNADMVDTCNYEPLIIQNPISFFQNNIDWKNEIENVYIEKL